MKEGAVIKVMWLVMGLGTSDPETFWKEVKKIYRREMDRLPEYGPNDILKVNLAHAVMLSAVYEACDPKLKAEGYAEAFRGQKTDRDR